MKRRRFAALLPLLLVVACDGVSSSDRRPFLYEIGGEPPSYLFGTIHLPDRRVTNLPAVVEEALAGCSELHTEIRLDRALDPELTRSKGRKLSESLSPELYQRLDSYLERHGVPIDSLESSKVWVAATTVLQVEIQAEMSGTKLDQVLWDKAVAAKKRTGAIESIEEQVAVLDRFTVAEQVEILADTLRMAEAGEFARDLEQMIEVYLSGDGDAVLELIEKQSGTEQNPALHRKFVGLMLDSRNTNMANRIGRVLSRGDRASHFFAVGAAHLPGPTGVVAGLRARGFEVTQVTPETAGK